MKARKAVSIILALVPLALAAAGAICFLTLLGRFDEGGELIILFLWIIPLVCGCTVPLAAAALIVNRKPRLLFVTILAVAELVLSVPPVLLFILMCVRTCGIY